jgi:hypothetical protein
MKHPFEAMLKPDRQPCLNYRQIRHILERIQGDRYGIGQVQHTSSVTIGIARTETCFRTNLTTKTPHQP